jgi:Uma2 family endonuclease
MSLATSAWADSEIEYPSSDGQPMAENTLQFQWIVTLQGGLDAMFLQIPDVFVAGDLLWYPVEGNNTIRVAPDTMVVFGRPKGHRGSYMQWREGNIAPQVVFEVLSPGNRAGELVRKLGFYERYGVEECYLYDPDNGDLVGWHRNQGLWQEIPNMQGWVSPRLQIRFECNAGQLELFTPSGEKFLTYLELMAQRQAAEQQAAQAQRQVAQAQQQAAQAQQQAAQAQTEARQARESAERLAAQLKSLGIEPNL